MDYEDIMNHTSADSGNPIKPHDIMVFLCCTVAFFADLAIISTILCFKQLRTASNVFIVSWAALDICAVIVTPVGYELVSIVDHMNVCFILQLGLALHFLIAVSVFSIFISWCIITYLPRFTKWIGVYYKVMMTLIWGIVFIVLIVLSTGCLSHKFSGNAQKGSYATIYLLLISIVTVRFINILKKHQGQALEQSKMLLTLCTAYIVCHGLSMGTDTIAQLLRLGNGRFYIIPMCFVFCNSVVTFSVLYFYDKPFQLHVRKILQRKSRENGRSFNEQEPFSHVSFHCPTEELQTNR